MALKLVAEELDDVQKLEGTIRSQVEDRGGTQPPNIVTCSTPDENDVLYISMRYIESDLKVLIEREGPLPCQRWTALDRGQVDRRSTWPTRAASSAGTEDGNILLKPGRRRGLATCLPRRLEMTNISSRGEDHSIRRVRGTVDYMAQEQIMGRRSRRTDDVYSLGSVAFASPLTELHINQQRNPQDHRVLSTLERPPTDDTKYGTRLQTQVDTVVAEAIAEAAPDQRVCVMRDFVATLRAARWKGAADKLTPRRRSNVARATPRACPASLHDAASAPGAPVSAPLLLGDLLGIISFQLVREPKSRFVEPTTRTTPVDRDSC